MIFLKRLGMFSSSKGSEPHLVRVRTRVRVRVRVGVRVGAGLGLG